MKEIRVTINHRINKDAHASITFVDLLDTEEEAESAGKRNAELFAAWFRGFGQASTTTSSDDTST